MEFKEVQRFWYQKLKDEGFKDAENPETGMLHHWSTNIFLSYTEDAVSRLVSLPHKQRYYELASQFIYTSEFKTIVAKNPHYEMIWKMHAEGTSYRVIGTSVNLHLVTVHQIVKRMAKVMLERKESEDDSDDLN